MEIKQISPKLYSFILSKLKENFFTYLLEDSDEDEDPEEFLLLNTGVGENPALLLLYIVMLFKLLFK